MAASIFAIVLHSSHLIVISVNYDCNAA